MNIFLPTIPSFGTTIAKISVLDGGTIPAEDILYSFVLIAGNILLFEFLSKKKHL